MSLISIIVPVHNVEKYVRACMDSLVNQSLQDIEVIAVNDASTDCCGEILKEYEDKYDFVKVVTYAQNATASQARKDGALMAQGKYVMFVDGDDELSTDACHILYDKMEQENVDMIHFGTEIINCGIPGYKVVRKEEFLSPYEGRIEGQKLVNSCFVEQLFQFNIWNKIYKKELCQKAFSKVKDGKYPKAQDLYAFFMLAFYAQSYLGISDLCLYRYNFGAGITGKDENNDDRFEKYCLQADIATEIKAFLLEENAFTEYEEAYSCIKNRLIKETVWYWYENRKGESRVPGLKRLLQAWGAFDLTVEFALHYNKNVNEIADIVKAYSEMDESLFTGNSLERQLRDINNNPGRDYLILTDSSYLNEGHQVLGHIKKKLENEGMTYRVIASEKAEVPDSHYKNYEQRLLILSKYFKAKKGTLFVSLQNGKFVFFDMLYAKLMGYSVVYLAQNTVVDMLLYKEAELYFLKAAMKLADERVCFSSFDAKYWKERKVETIWVWKWLYGDEKKKIDFEPEHEQELSEQYEGDLIVFLGDAALLQSQPLEAIAVYEQLIKRTDAKLVMYCSQTDTMVATQLNDYLDTKEYKDRIIMLSDYPKWEKFARAASVYMCTALYLGENTLMARLFNHKKIVMYQMPGNELMKLAGCVITLERGKTGRMADTLLEELSHLDDGIGNTREFEAESSFEQLSDFMHEGCIKTHATNWFDDEELMDTVSYYESLAGGVFLASEKKELKKNVKHYRTKLKEEQEKSRQLRKRGKDEREALLNSGIYKAGLFVTWLPRKIKGLFKKS